MEKRLLNINECNHCDACKSIQRQFYISEGKSLSTSIENFKLRKALGEVMSGTISD